MKIALFGGSFNPVHQGHLALADDVCVHLGYDRVLFVPAFSPPHKELEVQINAQTRLEMLRLAVEDDERFCVDDCEIARGGISYTYDTAVYLQKKYADVIEGKLGLIIGADLFKSFHLWYRAQELSSMCDIVLAQRPFAPDLNPAKGVFKTEDESEDFDIKNEKLFKNAAVLKNPLVPLSSGDIRSRIKSGESFKYLVGEKVFKYIVSRGLYGYK